MQFSIRDDLHLPCGRIDIGALTAIGRLAAEYTLVNNAFVPPLDDEVAAQVERRVSRLDEESEDYSPIETTSWSPSGSVLE